MMFVSESICLQTRLTLKISLIIRGIGMLKEKYHTQKSDKWLHNLNKWHDV